MHIYVASSWRNEHQPKVVKALRSWGHEVYDFRNPGEGRIGFDWQHIDQDYENWNLDEYRLAINHPIAEAGFLSDFQAMERADAFVMVMPCGNSAHIETGWAIGKGKPTAILIFDLERPDLMYKMATNIVCSIPDLGKWLRKIQNPKTP